jgi:hypothetical protein
MSITVTSRAKHWFGVSLLGTPESMSVPDDFYFEPCDRQKPRQDDISEPSGYMPILATAWFRLRHTHSVTKLSSWLWTLAIGGLIVVFGIYAGIHAGYEKHEAKVQAAQAAQDEQTQTRCMALTADQKQSDSECADLAARQKAQQEASQKAYWANFCANLQPENRARSPYCNGSQEH